MKRLIVLLVLLTGLFTLAPAALAGGWAVVSLDELPADIHAGENVLIGFTVLQHGVRPVHDLGNLPVEPVLVLTHKATAQRVTVEALPTKKPGHFVADITFPMDGVWLWSIKPLPFGEQEFPPLTVQPPAARSLLQVIRAFLNGSTPPATTGAPAGSSPAATGEALFVAKGCAACHDRGLNGAPFLNDYEPDPAFLRQWLRDPSAVRPGTYMPNLQLSDSEIAALIAYLEVRNQ